ncbi:hypothetical protein D5E76_25680 [Vibrio parahaemolyticus]|nr:hypothetical protein D5E76_25680 [Vibrio parahaemolyticus]
MKFRESPRSAVLAKLKLILSSSPEVVGYVYNLDFTFNVKISCCFSFECSESSKLTKRLRQIRNAWHFWFYSALVFTAQ